MPGVFVNVAGTWKPAKVWQNVAGVWKQITLYEKVGTTWKNISVIFTPDGGTVEAYNQYSVSATITCSQPAVWTYTGGGTSTNVSIPSGRTASVIVFSANAYGTVGNKVTATGNWTVSGTSNGITRNFTVVIEALGDNI